jgi:Chaperone of endosialidase
MTTTISADNGSISGSAGLKMTSDSSGVLALQTGANTTAVTVDTSGNVGVGVTPSGWASDWKVMQIGSRSVFAQYNSNNSAFVANNVYFAGTGGSNPTYINTAAASYYQQVNASHVWGIAPSGTAGNAITFTTAMTLDASGNLLVGATSNPGSYKGYFLTSGSGLAVNTSSSIATVFEIDTNSSNTTQVALLVYSQSSSAERLRIYSNGNVVNTNNSYGVLSDVKLKENIVDATPKLADVMRLRVRNYNLKTDPEQKQIGFVAQELQQVFPTMVDESPDLDAESNPTGEMTKSIKTSVLVPILVKAIQEQQALIDTLTTRITALENK